MRCEFARVLGCTGEERFRRRSKRSLIKAGGHSSSKVGERLPSAVSGVSTSMDAMIRTRRSLTVRETSRCSGRPGAISRSVSRRSSSVRTGETLSGSRDRRVPIAGEPPLAAPEHSRSLRSVDFPAESHSMIRPCSLRTSAAVRGLSACTVLLPQSVGSSVFHRRAGPRSQNHRRLDRFQSLPVTVT